METRDSFGYWVHRRRKALDLTQAALAQCIGCALVTLRKIEADERRPSPQMAERLAQCLALPAAEWPGFVAAATGTRTLAWLDQPATTAVRLTGNLPAPVTSLMGRDADLVKVTSLLQRGRVRMLTLTGPVGVGKTRLAVEVGQRLRRTYRDGVHLVELAAVADAALAPSAIAAAFAVREGRNRDLAQGVVEFLAARELLLLLDNFEQLLPATPYLSTLLANCPNLRLLVTSRARLHLYGEHEYIVSPLHLPDPDDLNSAANSPAVRLFCARAQAARADFQLTPSTTPAVAAICRQLDGLPLAIELAAARVKLFSPQELQQRLACRLPLGAQDVADLAPRLHVLENAIAWSYGLLAPAHRILLARLAIFAGGFSLPAAEAICAAPHAAHTRTQDNLDDLKPSSIAEGLNALLDQSLLVREGALPEGRDDDALASQQQRNVAQSAAAGKVGAPGRAARRPCPACPVQSLREAAAAESRFVLLETIRAFALEQLAASGELTTLRQRHAEYFATWAEEAEVQLQGPEQIFCLACLERNIDNLRAALTWLVGADQFTLAARMACALAGFWQRHGHYSEGRRWLDQILAAITRQPIPDALRARTLQRAAALAYRQGDWQEAQQWLAESLALYQTHGDGLGMARVFFDLGWIAIDQANWAEAMRLNRESLTLARAAQNPLSIYQALTHLGWTQLCTGDRDAAAPNFEEAHSVARQAGHTKGVAVSLTNLGWIALYRGDAVRAAALAQESLRLCCQLEERELMAECLELLAIAGSHTGNARRAARLSGAAEALREALHILHPPTQHAAVAHAAAVAAMQQQLPAGDFAAAWQEGRSLRVEAMVVFALGCGASKSRP